MYLISVKYAGTMASDLYKLLNAGGGVDWRAMHRHDHCSKSADPEARFQPREGSSSILNERLISLRTEPSYRWDRRTDGTFTLEYMKGNTFHLARRIANL